MSVEYRAVLASLRRATGAVLVGNVDDALFWVNDVRGKLLEMRKAPLAREERAIHG